MSVQANTAAEERWYAVWTCPQCGNQRKALHPVSYRGDDGLLHAYVKWECACGWSEPTADEYGAYLDFLRERGIEPDGLWVGLLEALRAKQ